ncbi:MAG TPA: cell division protein ZapA [Nevskiales bacterium]|nr:cell division protein ZapA [Nevskiales bacterium]
MSAKPQNSVTVRILEHEYQVQCPENERESLLAAAEYLNQRMNAIRKKGKALGMERIAVMTALNMAAELLEHKRGGGKGRALDGATGERLHQLQLRIDSALNEGR